MLKYIGAKDRIDRTSKLEKFHATMNITPIKLIIRWNKNRLVRNTMVSVDPHFGIPNNRVEIIAPIHGIGLTILKKYDGITANGLPPLISDQKANQYIKEVAKLLPQLNIEVDFQSNEKVPSRSKYKWEYIENRTARRSFATNLVKSGKLTTRQIIFITGHRTEDSFMKYLKLTTQENADLVSAFYKERT